jgi:FkbM family methyltransferase
MFHRLAFWKTMGMNPAVVFDIGANSGDWTRDARNVFPNARYEQFEANRQHEHPGRHMVLLGDTEKEVPFYKAIGSSAGANTGASVYLEVSQHYTPGLYTTEMLPMVPLDVYVARNNLPQPDLMKLDVQGAELDVLRGAESVLSKTKYVLMEVSLHRWNKDSPMIEEMISYMASHDFELIDIVDTHFTQNYLFQIDVIFAHKSTGLRKQDFYLR